jgi:hypothetical protein
LYELPEIGKLHPSGQPGRHSVDKNIFAQIVIAIQSLSIENCEKVAHFLLTSCSQFAHPVCSSTPLRENFLRLKEFRIVEWGEKQKRDQFRLKGTKQMNTGLDEKSMGVMMLSI